MFAPPSVLPDTGVAWRAETENVIVACFDLPPERPEVRVRIDEHGPIRSVSAPSTLSVGWWFNTPRYTPFFMATILGISPTIAGCDARAA